MDKNERDILKPFALDIAKHISEQCISFLKDSTETLSGDDSELENVWEEICMQVQYEHSFFWDAYDETVRSLVRGYLGELKYHEQKALWYQSDAYWDWYCNEEGAETKKPPVYDEDIISYIVNDHIYQTASNYTNTNIETFIEGQYLD